MKATLLLRQRKITDDLIIEMVIWKLPETDNERPHDLKYSLHCCRLDGSLIVRYDNESGKGDHRHYPDREEPYEFVDVETMIADFITDIRGAK
jgi:hypothetical protein